MSAAEVWCLFAVVAAGASAVASAVLAARLPTEVHSFAEHVCRALLAAAVACIAAALWIALA